MIRKLTPKQQRFCEEYVIDLNATKAANRAGYSEKTSYSIGHENLSKPEISKRITELQAELSEKTDVDAEYVIRGFVELFNKCSGKELVEAHDNDGALRTKMVFDPNGTHKALDSLGRHLGFYNDKLNLDHGGVIFNMSFDNESDK
jgi:phage terminase small subunit